MTPLPPPRRSGRSVAIVGSGPAGLAAADQLNQLGHTVTVYERDDRIGGLLMYGIPNMKLEKEIVERRNAIMEQEGVIFRTNSEVGGADLPIERLQHEYDAVLLAIGATVPKDLPIPGRHLPGIHFAMEYLHGVTKSLLDNNFQDNACLTVRGKDVIVIGSGDTGTDCIATAARQRARNMVNFGWRDPPHSGRSAEFPWPFIPKILKFDYAHKEVNAEYGTDPRQYNVLTTGFVGKKRVEGVRTVGVKWHKNDPASPPRLEQIHGSEKIWPAETVFIALGYTGPERPLIDTLSLRTTGRNTIATPSDDDTAVAIPTSDAPAPGDYRTSADGVFVAGDARRGQSLVVWAIKEGRDAAAQINTHLRQK